MPRRQAGGDPHVGNGSMDQCTQPDQGTLQRRPGWPGHPDITRFDGGKGERGRMDEVSQLVREKSQPFT